MPSKNSEYDTEIHIIPPLIQTHIAFELAAYHFVIPDFQTITPENAKIHALIPDSRLHRNDGKRVFLVIFYCSLFYLEGNSG